MTSRLTKRALRYIKSEKQKKKENAQYREIEKGIWIKK